MFVLVSSLHILPSVVNVLFSSIFYNFYSTHFFSFSFSTVTAVIVKRFNTCDLILLEFGLHLHWTPGCNDNLCCMLYAAQQTFNHSGQRLIARLSSHSLFFEAMVGGLHSNGCMLSALFKAACPVLCSGNGQYLKGRCMCHSGWKGAECDVPTNQCIDITCSSHGTCIVGTCICNPGYKGENCEEGNCFNKSW